MDKIAFFVFQLYAKYDRREKIDNGGEGIKNKFDL